jgi:hypothetical protein
VDEPSQSVWTLWRKVKSLSFAGNRTAGIYPVDVPKKKCEINSRSKDAQNRGESGEKYVKEADLPEFASSACGDPAV